MNGLSAESHEQRAIHLASGAVVDAHDVTLDGEATQLYFDVTTGWDAMARAFERERPKR